VLAGALYAPVALAFVITYKATRTLNFALGEWLMVGARTVAALGAPLGLLPALAGGAAGLVALAQTFNHLALRWLAQRSAIALIMVTLGLGALLRGLAGLGFRGQPTDIALPLPSEPLHLLGAWVLPIELAAAAAGLGLFGAVGAFFQLSRVGLALRALANDPVVATAMGIPALAYAGLAWSLAAAVATLAGVLWTAAAGGGFGVALVGLKVLPVVILGGLDSIRGALLGALAIGLLESLAAGYLDRFLGGGSSTIAAYLLALAILVLRPRGLFGRERPERV
jgi:branched-chain amino acid transport system permease protein